MYAHEYSTGHTTLCSPPPTHTHTHMAVSADFCLSYLLLIRAGDNVSWPLLTWVGHQLTPYRHTALYLELYHLDLSHVTSCLAAMFKCSCALPACRILAQLFCQDVPVAQNQYNPRRKDFLAYILSLLPPLDQLTSPHHEEVLRICKTSKIPPPC